MGKVLRKLQSNNGATLMLALLFFIVCAVTGSMILTSAGVSAGRLENMKRRDQNYFAVRSAVNMMKQQMLAYNRSDNTIKFSEILTTKEITYKDDDLDDEYYIKYNISGDVLTDVPNDYIRPLLRDQKVSYYSLKDDNKTEGTNYEPVSEDDFYEKRDAFYKPWYLGTEGDINDPAIIKFTKVNLIGNNDENLDVDLVMKLDSSGKLYISFKNHDSIGDQDNRDKYYMTLVFDIIVEGGRP
ncbi:MAG: hypothetical protein J6I76_11350, partial [Oribacterium sp.]|nr:hypothetical protein [Oribacterium sp.]